MTSSRPLSIALLTHSTNPRGGVVHALELGDALTRVGHRVVVHAPETGGRDFFRPSLCDRMAVPASDASGDLADVVEARIEDFVRWFADGANADFDVFHAGDGIGGNALARLAARGLIPGFARTVHHVDDFTDPRLAALQRRSIEGADEIFVVGRHWQRRIAEDFGRRATLVGNGVDLDRFSPTRDESDMKLVARLGAKTGPIFLSLGGIEPRKNSIAVLAAFARVRANLPEARWIVAGGATVLDHGAYRTAFNRAFNDTRLPAGAVEILGTLPQPLMAALYRHADTLVFPSLAEGFGLAVIEAMACGTPVVVSRLEPFTDYLDPDDALWCDPTDPGSIAAAMTASLDGAERPARVARGRTVAARHTWAATAARHLPAYLRLREATLA